MVSICSWVGVFFRVPVTWVTKGFSRALVAGPLWKDRYRVISSIRVNMVHKVLRNHKGVLIGGIWCSLFYVMGLYNYLFSFSLKYSMWKSVVSIVFGECSLYGKLIYNQCGVTIYVIWIFKTGILHTFIAPFLIL